MMNKEERDLLLSIIYEDVRLDKVDSEKLVEAIKSAMQEVDELKNIQRTKQGEEIVMDEEVITDDGEQIL